MATQVVDAITKKLDQLMTAGFAPNAAHISTQPEPCSFCSSTIHVTPPKLALVNSVESLAIHQVERMSGQTSNRPCKNLSE
jgi:hypothetical protein